MYKLSKNKIVIQSSLYYCNVWVEVANLEGWIYKFLYKVANRFIILFLDVTCVVEWGRLVANYAL